MSRQIPGFYYGNALSYTLHVGYREALLIPDRRGQEKVLQDTTKSCGSCWFGIF
jgi:hypothetical protein